MKPIIIHRPEIQRIPPFGEQVHHFYDRLENSCKNLGLSYRVETKKNKDLRRDDAYNHIVYHTRHKAPNWLNVKMSYLNTFFYLDPEGYSGWSDIRRRKFEPDLIDQGEADRYFQMLHARFVEPSLSKYAIPEVEDGWLPEGAILICLQVFTDEVLKLSRASADEMVESALRNRNNRPIILKRHPLCQSRESQALIDKTIAENPDCYQARGPIHALLAKADQVICVNSGVGFEALLHEKHVLLFGRSDYHFACAQAEKNEGLERVFQIPKIAPEIIRKFLYWYLNFQVIDSLGQGFDAQVETIFANQGWI